MPNHPQSLEDLIRAAIARYGMLEPGDRVLVAVSGGQDSLALLHALHGLQGELGISLHVGHLHHGIRGEAADADAEFVEATCREWGVPFTGGRAEVPKLARERGLTLEQAGREARYQFLRETAAREGCRRIATGHTATDRAETVLMNILRGAGLEGLRGIPAVNGAVIRPLMSADRPQTAQYCLEKGLKWAEDTSNSTKRASFRNQIRLNLMPILREMAPGVEAALVRLARAAEEELEWTKAEVSGVLGQLGRWEGEALRLDVAGLRALPAGLRARALREALRSLRGNLADLAMIHLDALDALLHVSHTGAALALPFEVCVEREYNDLVLCVGEEVAAQVRAWCLRLEVPGVLALPCGGTLRAERVPAPGSFSEFSRREAFLGVSDARSLLVRSWQAGDRMAPIGMEGTRKLQDVFTDAKIPRRERFRTPVVVNDEGELLWVGGLCTSRLAAVTPGREDCLHLCWEPPDPAETAAPRAD